MGRDSVGMVVDELTRYLTEHRMLFSTVNPRRFDTRVFERLSQGEWQSLGLQDDPYEYPYVHGSGVVVTAGMLGMPKIRFDDVSWRMSATPEIPDTHAGYMFWIHAVDLDDGQDQDNIAVEVYCGREEESYHQRTILTIPRDGELKAFATVWKGALSAFLTDFPVMSGREVVYRNVPTLITLSGDRVRVYRAIRRDAHRETNITAQELEVTFNLAVPSVFEQCVYNEVPTENPLERFRQLTIDLFDEAVTVDEYFDELHKSHAISWIDAWPWLEGPDGCAALTDEYASSIGIYLWFGYLSRPDRLSYAPNQGAFGYATLSVGQMWHLPLVTNGPDRLRINQPRSHTDNRDIQVILSNGGEYIPRNLKPGPELWEGLENRYPHTFGNFLDYREVASIRKAGCEILIRVSFRPKTRNSPQYDRQPFYKILIVNSYNPDHIIATGDFPVASPLGEIVASYVLGKITWGILEDYLAEHKFAFYVQLQEIVAANESRGFSRKILAKRIDTRPG